VNKKIIISIWSDPSDYINLLFLINYLTKKKIQIILICQKIERKKDFYYFVNKSKKLKIIEINKKGKLGYLYFFKSKLDAVKKYKPKTIISVNFISLFFSKFVYNKNLNWIYYNFDFNFSEKLNINNFLEKKIINNVNYIFLPSKSRVNLYKKIFFRNKKIFPIYNCFSKYFKIKNFKLEKIDKNLKRKKYFVRLGSFYKYHYLKELALSTKHWKKNIYLVMAGKSYGGYFKELLEFKKKNNLDKVILINNISYRKWFVLLKNALGGFALYKSINVSHRLMGGTSQKLNNYIFAGIPSFISNNADFLKFNKKFNTSITVNNSIIDINKKVNFLLKDKNFNRLKIKKNKLAFKNEFNFENQIEKVKKYII